jgi:hypothetical protein
MSDTNITKCYSLNGNGGSIYTIGVLIIRNCIFEECYVSGETKKGGAIFVNLEKSIGRSSLKLTNSIFKDCQTNDNEYGHSVYINVIEKDNEDFLFDTITLHYTTSINKNILLMDIYNLDGILSISSNIATETERLKEFKTKFLGFCSLPLNTTSFIVNNVENILSQQSYPLPFLICDRESLFFFKIQI